MAARLATGCPQRPASHRNKACGVHPDVCHTALSPRLLLGRSWLTGGHRSRFFHPNSGPSSSCPRGRRNPRITARCSVLRAGPGRWGRWQTHAPPSVRHGILVRPTTPHSRSRCLLFWKPGSSASLQHYDGWMAWAVRHCFRKVCVICTHHTIPERSLDLTGRDALFRMQSRVTEYVLALNRRYTLVHHISIHDVAKARRGTHPVHNTIQYIGCRPRVSVQLSARYITTGPPCRRGGEGSGF